jgi:Plant transposon protein
MDFSTIDSDFIRSWIISPAALKFTAKFLPANVRSPKRKRKSPEARHEFHKVDYTKTKWGLLIGNPLVRFPGNRYGKQFRRRFRLPFQLFEILVNICSDKNVFNVKDLTRVRIPIAIKLLCCLRVLGRDECFDSIEDMSDVPEKTVWWFFKLFITNFPKALMNDVVRPPKEGVELQKVMNVYTRMGFPGAVGSVDATHIRWHMCPVEKVHLATGKEKYPSVAFQVS